MAVTGELAFLSRLQTLGKEQAQPLERAQVLHQKVQKGDKLFWRGEYGEAASHYREALMVVRDDQGRVALQNKLARVQMHRQRTRDAISLLSGGLAELGEPSPPKRWVGLSAILELVSLWGLILFAWLQRKWPTVFPATVRYGDRSRAAQKLYRELAILSQGHDESVSQWAHMRELRWAVLLKQPLEIVVSFGRHAVFHAQKENHLLATWCCQKVLEAAQEGDAIAQASADFYVGRVAYLQGRWEEARERLERCVQLTQYTQDAYLKDAALQHLIRVYRNDGNFAEAVRVAGQLLSLYHKLGNLPRLSACCRHFALIYAAYGDFRQARNWSTKALEVALSDTTQSDDRALSLLRCYVLQGDLELRRGRSDSARRYIGEAIRLQREHQLSPAYLRDGMELLRKILGAEKRALRSSLARRFVRWCSYRWAILCGDLERAHHIRSKSRTRTSEHQVPQEMAYLFQESVGAERPGGIREAIPASTFAQNFLFGRVALRPVEPAAHQEADQIASMFPVGAVSSRWGRGALARDRTGTTTTQFSNASEAPWGYFFADDIG
jgi:tetratricopeptide (TPR) repeat protein